MTSIEQKEIQGINLKNLLAVIGSTITITVTLMIGVGKINKEIADVNSSLEKSILMNETRVRTIEIRLDALELQIQELKHKPR